jgi:hypothetical protein
MQQPAAQFCTTHMLLLPEQQLWLAYCSLSPTPLLLLLFALLLFDTLDTQVEQVLRCAGNVCLLQFASTFCCCS